MNAGAHGLAVVSALCAASDPKSVAIELCDKISVAKPRTEYAEHLMPLQKVHTASFLIKFFFFASAR